MVIDFGEDVVLPFELGNPVGLEAIFHDLLIDAVEARDVVAGAFFGVVDRSVRRDDEGPVGGLSEYEFAGGLVESALEIAFGVGEFLGEFDHAFFGAVEVRINPVVAVVEPDFEEAIGAPAGEAGHDFLMDSFDLEVFARCNHADFVLIAGGFAHEVFEELRAFVPPVAVEFGIVGSRDVRRGAEDFLEVAALGLAVKEEVAGVFGGRFGCPCGDIGFLAVEGEFAGDAMEFEAGVAADAIFVEVGANFGIGEIEAAVAVEFAVIGVTGITDFGAPDLARAFEIAGECGDTAGGHDWAECAVACGRIGLREAVRFENEEGYTVFGE